MLVFEVESEYGEIEILFDEDGLNDLIGYLQALNAGEHDHLSTDQAGGHELSSIKLVENSNFKVCHRVNIRRIEK